MDIETGSASLDNMSFPRIFHHGSSATRNQKPIFCDSSDTSDKLEDQEERLGLSYMPSNDQNFWFWHNRVLFCLTMHTIDVGNSRSFDMFGRPVTKERSIVAR
jgi:hypothetical protein